MQVSNQGINTDLKERCKILEEMYYWDIITSQIKEAIELNKNGQLNDKLVQENIHQLEVVAQMIPIMFEDLENVKELEIPLPTPPATPKPPSEPSGPTEEELEAMRK